MDGWVIALIAALIACFGFVLAFGAPYLPTLNRQITIALDLIDLKPGETLLELGCGDGRVLRAAAQRGWKAVGYELNPLLVLVAWLYTWRYRKHVRVIWGDFWRAEWPEYDGIFAFALPRLMSKLNNKIVQNAKKPIKLVSFAFTVPDTHPAKAQEGMYLYEYGEHIAPKTKLG